MRTETETPLVWVGCLACYNGGSLVGDWVEAVDAAGWACFNVSHEETWVMDHAFPGGIGEMSPSEAVQLGERIGVAASLGLPMPAYLAWCSMTGETDPERCQNSYYGEWGSVEDMIHEWIIDGMFGESVTAFYDKHAGWIDFASIANDLRMGGDIWTERTDEGRLYIFGSH